jgi:hypothetical protein
MGFDMWSCFTRVQWLASVEQVVEYSEELKQWSSDFDMTLNYKVAFVCTLNVKLLKDFSQQFLQAKTNATGMLERVVGIDLLARDW